MSILVIEQTFVTPKGLFQVRWIGEMEEDLEEIWRKLSLAGEESIVVMVEINSTDNWDQKAALTNGQSANHQAYHRVGNENNDEKTNHSMLSDVLIILLQNSSVLSNY